MISVVIPTCRRPDLLRRCLDGLAPGRQTLPPTAYEVIVADDGVPTVERLLEESYPWAKWTQGPRRGPASNRNHGARLAAGDWVAFTDDDCVPAPGWLAAFADAVHAGCAVYEGKTTCVGGVKSPLEHAPVNLAGGYLWSCNMLVAKHTFDELGGFDENFRYAHMEDVDFRDRLGQANHKFEFVAEAVVDHPARRLAGGWGRARTQESWVYWWYKSPRKGPAALALLPHLFLFRLRPIVSHGFRYDSAVAFASLLVEMTCLCVRLPLWELKYRRPLVSRGVLSVEHRSPTL